MVKTKTETKTPTPIVEENDGKKVFDLYNLKNGEVVGTFKGTAPLQAAKKAASKGFTDIVLRPKSSSNDEIAGKLFRFTGTRKKGQRAMPYPTWLAVKLKVPADQNKKGNEAKYPYEGFISTAKRAKGGYYKVPKVEGKTHMEAVETFVKTLGK